MDDLAKIHPRLAFSYRKEAETSLVDVFAEVTLSEEKNFQVKFELYHIDKLVFGGDVVPRDGKFQDRFQSISQSPFIPHILLFN